MALAKPIRKPRFISLRWRLLFPLCIVLMVVAMVGAYAIAKYLSGGMAISQDNILLESARAISERSAHLYERHRQEAQRVAFTVGVAETIASGNSEALQPTLEGLARLANLDSVILTDLQGREVTGLQRVAKHEFTDYAISSGSDLSDEPVVRAVLDEGYIGATGLLRTPEGIMLFTAVPVNTDQGLAGIALVGQRLEAVLEELHGSAVAGVALYGPEGELLQTTLTIDSEALPALTLAPEVFNQALVAVRQVPVQSLSVAGSSYEGAYIPFTYGPSTLGVIGALLPDHIPFATDVARQLVALLISALAGGVVITSFVGVNRVIVRANQVAEVAQALTQGEAQARTGMVARDEISRVGQTLDLYADSVKVQHDALHATLRRQRRELTHMIAILEALPDGIVVQDMEGRVVLVNDLAKELLGSQRIFRSAQLHELTAVVNNVLGPALAPGLYALGNPQQVDLNGRMLSAQAAAVLSVAQHRVGTVVVLRDITDHVRRERAREELLNRLVEDIQQPLADLARAGAIRSATPLNGFARDVTRHAVVLQKLIVEMRELTDLDARQVRQRQRPLPLDTLVWAVANEWRQVAQAAGLSLHMMIEQGGLYVLGDERRLRWAIGNVVDNAIKYTLHGGALTLEVRGANDSLAHLRVRDNGVGIQPDELPHVFTRFFRGIPKTKEGDIVRVPGTGQGLTIAKQVFEAHGGHIRVKSVPGVGTAVYFAIPLTAPVSLELPQFEADMEGETVLLESDAGLEDVEL